MPSSATITAFYSFSANTRARAAQVQANFDNLRGHLIPIEPLTQTSSNISHDIGSDEHRWRTGYFGTVDFDRSTSTASATIAADLNTATGEMVFKVDAAEKLRLVAGGISVTRQVNLAGTSTAAGGISTYATTSLTLTLGGASVDTLFGSTCTINGTGKPVSIGFRGPGNASPYALFQGATITASPSLTITVYRDGTTTVAAVFSWSIGAAGGGNALQVPLTPTMHYDFSATAGTHHYVAYARTGANTTGEITNAALIIHE